MVGFQSTEFSGIFAQGGGATQVLQGYRIALPVETKVRELDGKLWLAYNLARKGAKVAIGDLNEIKSNIETILPHVYIGDSAVYRESRVELYEKIERAGTTVVVLDTEGGIFYSPEMYLKRLSDDVLKNVHCILSWGEATDSLFNNNRKNGKTHSVITGNPCFDLLYPSLRAYYDEDVAILKKKFGKFILINTKFGRINHFKSSLSHKKLLYNNPAIAIFQKELFQHFIRALDVLSERYREVNFVVRPHPSEDHDTYRKYFKKSKNVYVEHWWSVYPWALAARAVIHNGCTTGIESALLGRRVVSYRPIINDVVDVDLPNLVSEEVFSLEELVEVVSEIITEERAQAPFREQSQKILKPYLHLLDGRSAERVSSALAELEINGDISFKNSLHQRNRHNSINSLLKLFKLGFLSIYNALQRKEDRSTVREYAKQKFSRLDYNEVVNGIKKIKHITQDSDELQVEPAHSLKNTYWVLKASIEPQKNKM